MTLTNVLSSTHTTQLLRALNSSKEYLFFDISVFNIGAIIRIKCTDQFKQINPNTWNGYDFFIENSFETEFYIIQELKSRLIECDHILTDKQIKTIKKL